MQELEFETRPGAFNQQAIQIAIITVAPAKLALLEYYIGKLECPEQESPPECCIVITNAHAKGSLLPLEIALSKVLVRSAIPG